MGRTLTLGAHHDEDVVDEAIDCCQVEIDAVYARYLLGLMAEMAAFKAKLARGLFAKAIARRKKAAKRGPETTACSCVTASRLSTSEMRTLSSLRGSSTSTPAGSRGCARRL